MTDKEIQKFAKKYGIEDWKIVDYEKYDHMDGFTLTEILNEYLVKYWKVEVRAGNDFGYGDDGDGYPYFEICGINKLTKEEMIAEIERRKEIEFQQKASQEAKEKQAAERLIIKLRKKYPDLFINKEEE